MNLSASNPDPDPRSGPPDPLEGQIEGQSSSLRRVKWTFLVSLVVLFVFVEFSRYLLAPYLDTLKGRLVMDLVILVSGVFFFGAGFDMLARMQLRLERQNRELLALQRAGLDIYGEASLATVLQKVVDQARHLTEARYGAVAVYDAKTSIREFVTSGVSQELRARIGEPPVGKGLLGIVLHEGQQLRIANVNDDPRSAGFPPHHPVMNSLLAVPIVCKGPFRGNLYVSERDNGEEFSESDASSLARFAIVAAIAIDNAHLNQQVSTLAVAEERVRIARELHDGMAQVLAYVNTKAQAVQAYLQKDDIEKATSQLDQLARAARDVYKDAREGIMALRTGISPDQTFEEALQHYLSRWQQQSGVKVDLFVQADLDLPDPAELQLLRIIQEALTNARKHSGANDVKVTLEQEDGWLLASVEDAGSGFDPASPHRAEFPQFGLGIMKERAESVGGAIEIDTEPGRGTRVKIRVPSNPKPITDT